MCISAGETWTHVSFLSHCYTVDPFPGVEVGPGKWEPFPYNGASMLVVFRVMSGPEAHWDRIPMHSDLGESLIEHSKICLRVILHRMELFPLASRLGRIR